MAREQVTTVPRHLQVYTHVTGVPRPSAHNAARSRPPKAPCEATAVKTAWARTSPHLQRCDRGVDGPGAGDDGPPAAGEGTMLPAHQLQGELAISVPRHRNPRATIHRGQRDGFRTFEFTTVFFKFALQLFALHDLFGFLIILALKKPY